MIGGSYRQVRRRGASPTSSRRRATRASAPSWAWTAEAGRMTGLTEMSEHVGGWTSKRSAATSRSSTATVNGHPLVYLDSAATSQKPRQVIDAVADFYANHNANAHRGIYQLGEEATERFEGARAKLARFFGAPGAETIVFTRGTTESMNLVAHGWGRKFLREGDEVLITEMEHHSNIVPWQMTAAATGATLRYIPLTDDGQLDLTRPRIAAHRADQDPRGHRHVERARHDHAAPAADRGGARGGRRGGGGCGAARPALARRRRRRSTWTSWLQRPQDARAHRVGRARTARPRCSRRWIRCSAAAR